eukprot:ANDGO_00307.mRNA.1 Acyl-coenzyme A oxidase
MSADRRIQVLSSHLVAGSTGASPHAKSESASGIVAKYPFSVSASALHEAKNSWFEHPRTIDVPSLKKFLDGPYHEWKEIIRKYYVDEKQDVVEYDKPLDEKRRIVFDRLRRFLTELPTINYYDLIKDPMKAFAAGEVQACSLSPSFMVRSGVHVFLASLSIYYLGSQKHIDEWFPKLADYSVPACFSMTEIGHGSNVRLLGTEARYDHITNEFVIHTPNSDAAKIWIGGTMTSYMTIVFARLFAPSKPNGASEDQGIHAFVVPLRNFKTKAHLPGVHVHDLGEKVGVNGVDNGVIWFEHVRIPSRNLLDRYGSIRSADGVYESPIKSADRRFNTMLSALISTRATLISSALGAMKVGLAIAIRYSHLRRAFGPPGKPEVSVMTYSTQRKALIPYVAFAYAADFASRYAQKRWLAVADRDRREVEALVSAFKAYVTWEVLDALQNAREACGGTGYLAANLIGTIRSDVDIYVTLEGANMIILQQVGKDMLTQYAKSMAKRGAIGALAHVLNTKLSDFLLTSNPFANASASRDAIQDSAFYLEALRYREQYILRTIAMNMRTEVQHKKRDGFVCWNEQLSEVLHLGKAHIERIIVEQFLKTIEECKEPGDTKLLLVLLCDLFALWCIERDAAWFLERRFMSAERSIAIRDIVRVLCDDVVPHLPSLVDAWGFPEELMQKIPVVRGNVGMAQHAGLIPKS